jgi:hypothetical protein
MQHSFLSGVGVKAARSAPEGFSLDADAATHAQGLGWL